MQRGTAGADTLRRGLVRSFGPPEAPGVGLWGTPAGTSFRAMAAYRQLSSLCGRRVQRPGKQYRWNFFSKTKLHRRTPVHRCKVQPIKPSEDVSGPTSRGLSLLILLVGRGTHVKALAELRVLAQLVQSFLRLVARQCKVQTAERIRRGLQLYSVYSRLWGEEAARAALKSLQRTLVTRGRGLLLSAVCFSRYNWEGNKITDDCLKSAVRDLESVGALCKATIECEDCGKRQVIDKQMGNIEYCLCEGQLGYTNTSRIFESWEPFIERKHHIVWRKRHDFHKHLFAYKVYGTYDDVSLSAFMEVQLNSDFRTEWDDTALQLRVLDSHKESNSDLIYWLVKYPQFFSNRDYVYKRRFLWNKEKQEVVIMSEAVDPDGLVPEEKGVHRVNEYWSTMVIRAKEDANKPGLEYTLTYFDNPGTSLPQWLTNFIAVTGYPSFLEKLHNAAVSLQAIHEDGKDVYVSLPSELRYPRPVLEKPDIKEIYISDVPTGEEVALEVVEAVGAIGQSGKEVVLSSGEHEQIQQEGNLHANPTLVEQVEEPETPSELKVSEYQQNTEIFEDDFSEDDVTFAETLIQERDVVPETESSSGLGIVVHASDEIESILFVEEYTKESEIEIIEDSAIKKVTDSDAMTRLALDKSLHMQRGSRTIIVDLLEAMEVVAPDLDEPTMLSKNIEKMTVAVIAELEKKTVLTEKLAKLKNRLQLFQQHASQKKESSIQKMYELERRSHYDNYDPLTRVHLDRLFEAMRDVLEADKDMRTGKGLLQTSPEDMVFDIRDPFGSSPFVMNMKTSESDSKSNEITPCDYSNSSTSKMTKGKEVDNNTKKNTKSSDDPPPPSPSPLTPPSQHPDSTRASNTSQESSNNSEARSNEIGAYNGMNANTISLGSATGWSAWKSWMYVPYISTWLESTSKTPSAEGMNTYEHTSVIESSQSHEELTKPDVDATSQSFITQVWYIVGLGWIFSTKAESIKNDDSSENNRTSQPASTPEKDDDYTWYWHPIDGAYRLYAWAFKSTNANA